MPRLVRAGPPVANTQPFFVLVALNEELAAARKLKSHTGVVVDLSVRDP